LSQTSRSGLSRWSAWSREGGHGERRFLAKTNLADGALLDFKRRKELT
jgi:hypothetical protein